LDYCVSSSYKFGFIVTEKIRKKVVDFFLVHPIYQSL